MRKIIYPVAGLAVLIAVYIAWQHWRSTDEIEVAKELVAPNLLLPATAQFAPRNEWVAQTLPSGAIRLPHGWILITVLGCFFATHSQLIFGGSSIPGN